MVSSVSFSGFGNCCAKGVQKKLGNPPQEMLDKLKQAGVPDDVIAKGKDAVESFASDNKIALPKPPEPPKGEKSQGAEHANERSILKRETSDALKAVMEKNGIVSSGKLKEDLVAIKTAIKSLDVDAAKVLKEKLATAGVDVGEVDKNEAVKKAFQGLDQLGAMNKHLLVGKSAKKAV